MDIEPTSEDISRPCLSPYIKGKDLADGEKEVSLKDILKLCGNGIYVTGFNDISSNQYFLDRMSDLSFAESKALNSE